MKRKSFVLLPLALLLVISVSGCTELPCIPFLDPSCGGVTKQESDVIMINSLDANPSTISTGQSIRLTAVIQNKGNEAVPQKYFTDNNKVGQVTVKLYDYCEGLFKEIKVTCPSGDATNIPPENGKETGCWIATILPKQSVVVSWNLVAADEKAIPLEIQCNLRVYVDYPYQSIATTNLYFIDSVEAQREREQGTLKQITSYTDEGLGPAKPYLLSEDIQPIPVTNGVKATTTLSFQVKNEGSGFLKAMYYESQESKKELDKIWRGDIEIIKDGNPIKLSDYKPAQDDCKYDGGSYNIGNLIAQCLGNNLNGDVQLIGKESPKQFFSLPVPHANRIEIIAPYYFSVSAKYLYEFRKETKVTIKPPKIT